MSLNESSSMYQFERAEAAAVEKGRRVTVASARERPQLDFVLPGLLAGTVGMIVGQGAIGKSFLGLGIGLAVATGQPVAGGLWPASPKSGKVMLLFGEDDNCVLQERLYWLRKSEGIDDAAAELIDRSLEIFSEVGLDMRVAEKTATGMVAGPYVDRLRGMARGARLLVVDPLLFLQGGDENDNNVAAALMQILAAVARETRCAIIVLHHVGKGGGEGKEEWTAARGASAFTTSVRWQCNMAMPSKAEMKDYGIDAAMRPGWVRVAVTKLNYGAPPEVGWLQRGEGGVVRWQQLMKTRKATAKWGCDDWE